MTIELKNRRKFSRIRFDRHVNLEFISDRYDHCPMKDLSLTGMFVKGNLQKQLGNYCLFTLDKTETSNNLKFQALAKVVRKDDEGVAIEFTSMPHDSYMFLQLTLLNESEDPSGAEQLLPDSCPYGVTDQW